LKTKRREIIFAGVWLLFWILLVLYPQPQNLGKSIYRIYKIPVNPEAEELSLFLEEIEAISPQIIEKFVIEKIPYKHDWVTYDMPWYFPTAGEVLEKRRGDCKSRMVIMASAFEYYNFPYNTTLSPSHIWIDYEGKNERRNENREVAMFSTGDDFTFKLPKIEIRESIDLFSQAYIKYMPEEKKYLLFTGFIVFLSFTFWRTKNF